MLASENLYYRVMEDIRVKIMDGTYPLNSKIPSEKKLQDIYGISRVTLRNAIDGLVKDGLIKRIQGKGSYVRKPKKIIRMLRYPDVRSFSKVARESGFIPSVKIFDISQMETPEELVDEIGKRSLFVKRLYLLDGEPIMLENNYLPLPQFKDITEEDVAGSLYETFYKKYEIKKLVSKKTIISISLCNVEQSRIFEKSVGFPLFFLDTVITDEKGDIVQIGKQYIVSDRYEFSI